MQLIREILYFVLGKNLFFRLVSRVYLALYRAGHPGKTEVILTMPYSTQFNLSLAYTPDVVYPCKEIETLMKEKSYLNR